MELLEVILPCKEYLEAKSEYDRLKKIRNDLHKKVATLQEKNTPVVEFKKCVHIHYPFNLSLTGRLCRQLEKDVGNCEKEREKRKKAAKDKFQIMKNKTNDSEKLVRQSFITSFSFTEPFITQETEGDEIANALLSLKKTEKARKDRIAAYTKEIHKIEHELAHPPETEDLKVIEEDMVR